MKSKKSNNTRRAYSASWKDFKRWCRRNNQQALPASPATLKEYLLDRSRDLALSTLNGRVAAIRYYHDKAGHETPTASNKFREWWRDVQGEGQVVVDFIDQYVDDERPYLDEHKQQIIPEEKNDLITLRDRAIILLGIFGDLQRSEIAGVNREDIRIEQSAAFVQIEGGQVSVRRQDRRHFCPVRALHAWIEASQINEGPLFRPINRHGQIRPRRISNYGISLVVKRAAENAGLDPSEFSAEDLRQRPAK